MSQWTHVCGAIRVDALVSSEFDDTAIDLVERFGQPVSFDDPESLWDSCSVPLGSEGSIQYSVSHTGDQSSLSWGIVDIWGDLRDYSNAQEIYEWVKKACIGLFIRSCSIKVDVEYGFSYHIYNASLEEEPFIEIRMSEIK